MLFAFFSLIMLWIHNSIERSNQKYNAHQTVATYHDDEALYCRKCYLAKDLLVEYNNLAKKKGLTSVISDKKNYHLRSYEGGSGDVYVFYSAILRMLGYDIPELSYYTDYNTELKILEFVDSMYPMMLKYNVIENFLDWNASCYDKIIQQPFYNADNIITKEEFIIRFKRAFELCTSSGWMEGLNDNNIIDKLAINHQIPPPSECVGLRNTCYDILTFSMIEQPGLSTIVNAIMRDMYNNAETACATFTVPIITQANKDKMNPWQARKNNDDRYEALLRQYRK